MNLKPRMQIPSSMQARLGLVFLLLAAALSSLVAIYWLWVLEPRLEDDARAQANVMTQSYSWSLADNLSTGKRSEQLQRLGWAMDEILILTDPSTDTPFVEGISVELDSTFLGPNEPLRLIRGNTICQSCFVSDVPLYAKKSRELLGIATFYSNSNFFEQLRNDVRKRLYLIMVILVALLSAAWWIINSLLTRLQRSDAVLSQTFDAMSFPVISVSDDLRTIVRSNESARLNFSDERVHPGALLEQIFHDSDDYEVLRKAVTISEDIQGYECELRGVDNKPYWALVSCVRVELDKEAAYIISIAEVTQLKQAENAIRNSEERFATVVDSIDDLVYVADIETYELLFINKATRDAFGDVRGKICWQVLQQGQSGPCDFCTNDKIVDRNGRPTGAYTWDFRNTVTGEWYTCRDRAIRWTDGRIVRLETATNTSELKNTQVALEKARDQAEAASRAKSDFLATMSHEIRTPMNGIIGMVKLLQRSTPREDQAEYIDAINASSEQLLLLINDILDISKIEAGKLHLEPSNTNLHALIVDTVKLFEHSASEKGLTLNWEIDPATPSLLQLDATRLRQILLNLISNAVKFTLHGGVDIKVSGKAADNRNAAITITVRDTGVGIPAERAHQIFDEFTQLDMGSARRFEGTGLGLAICKRLVTAMGGDIRLAESSTGGSTFEVRLNPPLADGSDETTEKEQRSMPQQKTPPLYILLVEDNQINSRVAMTLLEQSGHKVVVAVNGAEALELIERERFDLILMDLHMPVMDGFEATRRIRALADREKANTPIAALTADIMQEERDHCMEIGMNCFLAKPFTPDKLDAIISQAINPPPLDSE